MVQAIVKTTEMFGKSVASHYLMAFAGEHGLFSESIAIYLFLQPLSSKSINSGDGRSSLYLISASSRLTYCEHMILGTRPSREMAVTVNFEKLSVDAYNNMIKKGNCKISLEILLNRSSWNIAPILLPCCNARHCNCYSNLLSHV